MSDIIQWLEKEEGLLLRAYKDEGGVWTIGLGSTFFLDGRPVKQGDVVTKEEAYKLAEFVVLSFSTEVKRALLRPVNKNQFTALTSLCYNCGPDRFRKSVVVQMINAGQPPADIAKVWLKSFVTASGKPSAVLVGRRKREAALFLKP